MSTRFPIRRVALAASFALLAQPSCLLRPEHEKPLIPLAVGNEWTYVVTPFEFTPADPSEVFLPTEPRPWRMVVSGTREIQGETWYVSEPLEWCPRPDAVVVRIGSSGPGYPLRYPASSGDVYELWPVPDLGGMVGVRVTKHRVEVPAGDFFTYRYEIYVESVENVHMAFEFAPGVGLVRIEPPETDSFADLESFRLR